jgi:hypothetical protein
LGELKEALNISDFEGSDTVGLPGGRKEHGFGDVFEQLEKLISDLQRVLAFLPCCVIRKCYPRDR